MTVKKHVTKGEDSINIHISKPIATIHIAFQNIYM